jgi:hypothetical protein
MCTCFHIGFYPSELASRALCYVGFGSAIGLLWLTLCYDTGTTLYYDCYMLFVLLLSGEGRGLG